METPNERSTPTKMECEEVQICDICGDAGYDDELAICVRCNDSAEHIYCMVTKLESVPLQWVCERCEMEEKASLKRRFPSSESPSIEAIQTHISTGLSSCMEMNEAESVIGMRKASPDNFSNLPSNYRSQSIEPDSRSPSSSSVADKVLSGVQAQFHDLPKLMEKSIMSSKETSAVKACLSMSRPEGVVVKAAGVSSPKLEPSRLHKSTAASKVSLEGIVNVSQKNALNLSKDLADRPLSGSKRVFSRSFSLNATNDQPTFLLPSRPPNLMRSKSAVVRSATNCTGSLSNKSLHKEGSLTCIKNEWNNIDSIQIKHECSIGGSSHVVESSKTTPVETKFCRQAGEQKNRQYGQPRGSESLQFYGSSSDCGKSTYSNDLKETRRCYRCNEVGHIAAMCKSLSGSSPRAYKAEKAVANFDRVTSAKYSVPETFLSLQSEKSINSPKRSLSSKWQDVSTSCKLETKQTGIHGKEGLIAVNAKDMSHQPSSKAINSPKRSTQDFSVSCKLATKQTHIHGKDGLVAVKKLDVSHRLSPKVCDSQSLQEKMVTEQVHSPKGRISTQCAVRDTANLQQAQGVDVLNEKHLQQSNDSVVRSNPHSTWGSEELVSREHGTTVTMFSGPHLEPVVEPCIEVLWSGCFNILRMHQTAYNGMQAHASNKADPRVSEAVKSLPFELHLEELKRGVETDTWPRSLQEQPPTVSNIGVYFFPMDMECHDKWYKPLLDHLAANDLALRTRINFFQLLIFPSQLLPEADQCWEDRQYLWGILRSGTLKS